jgi:hypothetical protein
VGDRGPEGALLLGALDVDVDPLVVAGEIRVGVDVLLRDLLPVGRADGLALQGLEPLDALDLNGCHHQSPY